MTASQNSDIVAVGAVAGFVGVNILVSPIAGRIGQLATLDAPHGPWISSLKHTIVDGVAETWDVPTWVYVSSHATIVAGMLAAGAWTAIRWRRKHRGGWRARQEARMRDRSGVWARPGDVPALIVDDRASADRVILGELEGTDRVVAALREQSVLVCAPTGSGKTTAIVVPALLRWSGPAVVTSTKRDVFDVTHHHRSTIGPVFVFDPAGVTGQPSAAWSPLVGCETWKGASDMAHHLIDAARINASHGADAAFWQTQARMLFAPLLFWAANTSDPETGERRTVLDVYRAVQMQDESSIVGELGVLGCVDATAAFVAVTNMPDDTRGGIYATALQMFDAFAAPNIRHLTCIGIADPRRIDWGDLLDFGGTLYLVADAETQDQLRPVFEAMIGSLMRYIAERHLMTGDPLLDRLLVLLDEAAHVASPARFDGQLNSYRAMGVSFATVWQSVSQIEHAYGTSVRARNIAAGHPVKVVLGGIADRETLEWVSALIGTEAVSSVSVSSGRGQASSTNDGDKALTVAPVEWLRQRPNGTAIAVAGNAKPLRLVTRPWFDDPSLVDLVPVAVREQQAEASRR